VPVLKVQTDVNVWIPVDGAPGETPPPSSSGAYISFPGTSGSYASVAQLTLPSVTHRFVWEMRRTTWTANEQKLTVTKWNDSGPYGWWAAINANGSAHFRYSTQADPRAIVYVEGSAPSALPPTDEFIELDQSFDGPTRTAQLSWRHVGGSEWTSFSRSPTGASVASILDSSAPFRIAASGAGNYRNLNADVRQLTLYNDKGQSVFTLDPDVGADFADGSSWVSDSGHTVTLSGGATIKES